MFSKREKNCWPKGTSITDSSGFLLLIRDFFYFCVSNVSREIHGKRRQCLIKIKVINGRKLSAIISNLNMLCHSKRNIDDE